HTPHAPLLRHGRGRRRAGVARHFRPGGGRWGLGDGGRGQLSQAAFTNPNPHPLTPNPRFMNLVIGSRGSKLALWQSEWVKARLEALDPEVSVRIEVFKTSGDVMRDVPLASIGGQGVFTKELELALLDRRVGLAVHSLKDLPTIIPEGLAITATPEREDPRDALVLRADADARDA